MARYQCPPSYNCVCHPGTFVTLTTVRRHRDLAQQRLRAANFNHTLSLALPPPTICAADSDLSSHSSTDKESSEVYSSDEESDFNDHDAGCLVTAENGSVAQSYENNIRLEAGAAEAVVGFGADETASDCEEFSALSNAGIETISVDSSDYMPDNANFDEVGSAATSLSCHLSSPGGTSYSGSDDGDFPDEDVAIFLHSFGWLCGFYLRHNATIEAMNDLLRRDNSTGVNCWKTVRSKAEHISGIRVSKHPYCYHGHELLSVSSDHVVSSCTVSSCRAGPEAARELSYIHLWECLCAMLRDSKLGKDLVSYVRNGFLRQAADDCRSLEDFYSGEGFREYATRRHLFADMSTSVEEEVHLFLFLSTDGAPAFRSNTKSFWPVLVYIGNIPPDKRYREENVLPVMCIPGNPTNLESFLEPLFLELEQLQQGAFCELWDGRKVKVCTHLMHEMADLQAKRKLCLIKGVNGHSPCPFCEISGVRASQRSNLYYPDHILVAKRLRNGRKKLLKRVYWTPEHMPLRTEESIRTTYEQIAQLTEARNKASLAELQKATGIIGEPEIVRRFSSIRPYLSMPIDLMHLLFENVAPQMVSIWTGDVDTQGEHDYLEETSTLQKVDAILNKSGSGIDCSLRRPRGLSVKKQWKADEWRTFVVTTSMVALHQFLPQNILDGWWSFCQLSELSMRPYLSEANMEELAGLCISFYRHYSETYYKGIPSRLHLMKYTIHLILHIPHSTSFCGPLVCLSQFPVERYIGRTKEATKARHRYSESVAERWAFSQSLGILERISGNSVRRMSSPEDEVRTDRRSTASNSGNYMGYYLRGYASERTVDQIEVSLLQSVRSRLQRFYEADLNITRHQAGDLIQSFPHLRVWNRLVVQKQDELTPRKYERFLNDNARRSCSFFAAEFEGYQNGVDAVDVFYGRVAFFLEHLFRHPQTGNAEQRILVVAHWASRGLRVGKQHQIFKNGGRASDVVFPICSIENVTCIARNIAVLEVDVSRTARRITRTYFVDALLEMDMLLTDTGDEDEENRRLCGIS